jgi:tetratricopeptide (TPR) repeat protein
MKWYTLLLPGLFLVCGCLSTGSQSSDNNHGNKNSDNSHDILVLVPKLDSGEESFLPDSRGVTTSLYRMDSDTNDIEFTQLTTSTTIPAYQQDTDAGNTKSTNKINKEYSTSDFFTEYEDYLKKEYSSNRQNDTSTAEYKKSRNNSKEIKNNNKKINNNSTNNLETYRPRSGTFDDEEIALIKQQVADSNFDLTSLEEYSILEMPLTSLTVEEGKSLTISLESSGWILKRIDPPLVELKNRIMDANSTIFRFSTRSAGSATILFIRFNDNSRVFLRKTYALQVRPRALVQIDENLDLDKALAEEDSQEEKKDFRLDLARNLYEQQKFREARKRFESLNNDGKSTSEIYYKLGVIERSDGNNDKALEYFQQAIKEKDTPYYHSSLVELIRILKDARKYNDAIDVFFNYGFSESLSPTHAEELIMLLADVYFNMGDYVSSASEYRRYLENFPETDRSDKALFYLAYSMENYHRNPEFKEAYRLYQKLINEYPESSYYNLAKNRVLYLDRHYLKLF